jgi:hypothetical protein
MAPPLSGEQVQRPSTPEQGADVVVGVPVDADVALELEEVDGGAAFAGNRV